jgi:hypothetical protein
MKKLTVSRSLYLTLMNLSQWLSFHHGAFNQISDQDGYNCQGLEQRSSLRKMLKISDLFQFISEFVLEE